MKRKKTNLILCSLILLASLLAEVYCFLEFRRDILIILGTGVIVLVAAFMTLDSVLSMIGKEDGNSTEEDGIKAVKKHLAELEKAQKATFVMLKKNAAKEQEMIKKIMAQMEQQRETVVKAGKLIVRYDRENTLQLEAIFRKMIEKPDFDDTGILLSLGTANQELEKLVKNFGELKESFGNISITVPMTLAEEPVMQEEPEEDIDIMETAEQETAAEAESVIMAEEAPIPEPVAESEAAPAPEIDTSDPNKMMSPDDIAALLASMGGEEAPAEEPEPETVAEPEAAPAPEIDTSDPNKIMSPDDIAALLASMGGEEAPAEEPAPEPEPETVAEPEAAPAPEIDMSDPNKMMSADDIAALLASMGQ